MSSMADGSDCPRRPCPIAADGASVAALATLSHHAVTPYPVPAPCRRHRGDMGYGVRVTASRYGVGAG